LDPGGYVAARSRGVSPCVGGGSSRSIGLISPLFPSFKSNPLCGLVFLRESAISAKSRASQSVGL
jgi:hypothetical protein